MDDTDRSTDDEPLRPGISGSMVSALVLFASANGVDTEQMAAIAGLDLSELISPEARLPEEVLPKLWGLLLDATPGRAVTMEMAAATPYSYFGVLAFAGRFAANLREALECFIRYRRILSNALEVSLVVEGDRARVGGRHPIDEAVRGASAEVGMALALRHMRENLGVGDAIIEVHTRLPLIGPRAAYEAYLGVPVVEGQRDNAVVLHAAALDQPIAAGDPTLFSYIEARLERARERLRVPDALAEIREVIANNAALADYSAEAVARGMGMSLRGLQRRMTELDGSLKDLLDEARDAHARELLDDRRLSTDQVAFLLGYANERSFRRAFKRRTGTTPAQFRNQARNQSRGQPR